MAQNLEIVINAQDKTNSAFGSAQRSLDTFSDKLDSMKPQFQQLATAGTVAFAAIAGVAATTVKAFVDAQAQTEVTNQALSNTLDNLSNGALKKLKKDTGDLRDGWAGLANAALKAGDAAVKMGFDDETAAASFAKLFAVTKDVTQSQKEMALAMDLARYKNISLEDATQKLVMIHAGATKELKSLGIAVVEGASVMQNLDSVTKQVTGTAETFALTTAGSMEILKVRMDNLKETIGGALEPAFVQLLDKVQPLLTKFEQWANENPDLIAKIVLMGGAIAGLVAVVGLLGLALPVVIAAFTALTGPVGLVIGLIALLVINFDTVKLAVQNLYATLEGYGVIIIFRDIWANIQKNFSETLIPAVKQLWEALKPLFPYLQEFGKFLGAVFIVTLVAVAKIIEGWIYVFTALLEIAMQVGTYVAGALKTAFDAIGNTIDYISTKVNALISSLSSLWSSMSKFGGSMMSGAANMFGGGQKVNDAIITPTGRVITPAQDDYIMATKNPAGLFGGGSGGFILNINGGNYLSEDAAFQLGDMIIDRLRMELKM